MIRIPMTNDPRILSPEVAAKIIARFRDVVGGAPEGGPGAHTVFLALLDHVEALADERTRDRPIVEAAEELMRARREAERVFADVDPSRLDEAARVSPRHRTAIEAASDAMQRLVEAFDEREGRTS